MATSDSTQYFTFANGKSTIVDDIDADLLRATWNVSVNNYVRRNIYAKIAREQSLPHTQHLHRLILERMIGRSLAECEYVDHINGNRLDNRRCNLRLATKLDNARNAGRYKNNRSGYKGVGIDPRRPNKWRARIRVNGKLITLGYSDTPEEAYKLYAEAAQKHFGDFARLDEVMNA